MFQMNNPRSISAREHPLALLLYLRSEYHVELISELLTVGNAALLRSLRIIRTERFSVEQWNAALYYLFNVEQTFQSYAGIQEYLLQ